MKLNEAKKGKNRFYVEQIGITLIALVITIVVLLILAGVSINALFSDNGIIERAKEARNKIDKAIEKDLEEKNKLNNWLEENGTIKSETTPIAPTKDTAPYYPDTTFTKVDGTDLDNGLVIKDAKGNEYVWIEVPKSLYTNNDYNTQTTTADQKPEKSTDYDKIEYCLHKYTDYYRRNKNGTLTSYSDTYYSDETTGLTSEQYIELKQKMLKSVYENGGFWIGRYEAGITENRTASGTPTVAPISKQGTDENPVYPYTYVTCSQAQTLANMLTTENYTSSLMFGVQWDLVLKHIETKEVAKGTELATIQSALRSDSTSWGNYYNASFTINRGRYADYVNYTLSTTWTSYNKTTGNNFVNDSSVKQVQSSGNGILLTTGASDASKKMNIYDLAGNVWEWTLEYTDIANGPCARRGGGCNSTGSTSSIGAVSYRHYHGTTNSDFYIGLRLSLFK